MWEFFIRNNRFSYLLMFVLIGAGFYSLIAIPKESAPEVEIPVGIVTTVLPGASALEIEALVTNELERSLSGKLTDVKSITSTSREGVSNITVEFDARADIDTSIAELKDEVEIAARSLPSNAETPIVSDVDFVDQPILSIAIAGEATDAEFTALADEVEAALEGVSGVSRIDTSGVREREVSIVLTPASLARYDLTIDEVINGLRSANSVVPVGGIITNDITYNIAFEGDINTTEEIADVPIAVRGGQPVYVRDVGTVFDGVAVASTLSRLSVENAPSENSITLNIYKTRGGDITRIAAAVRDELDTLSEAGGILAGYTVYVTQDNGELIRSDLIGLSTSGLITVTLVILLLVVAIGWREGLIAGTAIPLSFMIGFIGLYFSGNTINFISTFSLILGIGILVDSAIVVVEGINKRMKDDPTIDKIEAAALTVRAFASPITSGTLTTVAMFSGLFIVSGVTGQFISSIPFTIISILLASLLVALGFIPLIASSFLRRQSRTKLEQKQIEYARKAESYYRGLLEGLLSSTLRIRLFFVAIILGLITSIMLIPAGLVQVVFFGESDSDSIFIEIELPEGSVKENADLVVRQVEEIAYMYPETIEAFTTTVGAGSVFGAGGQNEKLANLYLVLREDRAVDSLTFMEVLRADLAPLEELALISVSQLSDGPPTGSPIGVTVSGQDLSDLSAATTQVADALATIDGVTNIRTSNTNNSTEIVLSFDNDRAAALGLNTLSVSQALRAAVTGTEVTSITSLTESIDVVVRLSSSPSVVQTADTRRTTVDDIRNLLINTPSGEQVLVSSFVDVSLREANTAINHDDGDRVMTVSADLAPGGNVQVANAVLVEKMESEVTLPAGITYSLGGETEDSGQAFIELFLALIVGIVLMIAVLVLEFNSFRYTFYVLSILPFSLIGILYGLAITGSSLSFPSIMGFIALTGIVVNNSILLIDMMNYLRAKETAMSIRDVVLMAAESRLRPILLTTTTTVVGMLPLLFSDPIWVPLATAIIFGLSFSVVITLFLIPVIYVTWPGRGVTKH